MTFPELIYLLMPWKKKNDKIYSKNISELNLEEFETFLVDKLNWNNDGAKTDNEKATDKKEKDKSDDIKSKNEDI